MLGAIIAAATGIKELAGGVSDLLSKASGKDKERIQASRDALARALAGDATAVEFMRQQAGLVAGYGSATAIGKEAYRRALQEYYDKTGGGYAGASGTVPNTGPTAGGVVGNAINNIRNDAADAIRTLGAGATNNLANGVAAPGSAQKAGLVIPTTQSQIMLLVGAAAAAFLIFRKK